MIGLLYKDICVNKKLLAVMLAAFAIAVLPCVMPLLMESADLDATVMVFTEAMWFGVSFLLMGEFVQNGIFEADERKKWADYIIASPLREAGQVRSKYLFSLVCSVALVAWCFLSDAVGTAIIGAETSSGLPQLIIILIFSADILMRAIEYPFYIRFGKNYGNKYRQFFMMFLFFLFVVYLLFGDLSFFNAEKISAFIERLLFSDDSTEKSLLTRLAAKVVLPSVVISSVAYFTSYMISVRLYKKGTESFEE